MLKGETIKVMTFIILWAIASMGLYTIITAITDMFNNDTRTKEVVTHIDSETNSLPEHTNKIKDISKKLEKKQVPIKIVEKKEKVVKTIKKEVIKEHSELSAVSTKDTKSVEINIVKPAMVTKEPVATPKTTKAEKENKSPLIEKTFLDTKVPTVPKVVEVPSIKQNISKVPEVQSDKEETKTSNFISTPSIPSTPSVPSVPTIPNAKKVLTPTVIKVEPIKARTDTTRQHLIEQTELPVVKQ